MEIEFGVLEIGEEFFDKFSGLSFIKENPEQAKCVDGGDYFERELENFEIDDLVIVD